MLKIHNSPSSIRNTSNQLAKNQHFDSTEIACSIDISKIDTPNDIHEFDQYALEPPFSMQDMQTEESHQIITPTNKAFNRIITHSKAVGAHKGLRQEVLASTAPSDNIPQNARLSSLMESKQNTNPHNASDKILLNPSTTARQLTKSVETLIEKPKARGANKRHTEPIKISTLKLCRDIEKKQRIRDNKPYVDLGSSDDDSDEIMEKIYEVPYSPALEGAVILEKLPEEGEMDEIDLDSIDSDVNKRESAACRWNKFIIKSSGSPTKEKYQPSFVLNPEEEKPKNKQNQSQPQGKAICSDMIAIKKLFEKDSQRIITTERSATTTTQSYKIKLNTTPRQSPGKDGRIDQLMMLDSAWNGLDTRENETSSDEKLAAFIQEREAPKIVQRSQSLENLQGGRKIRQSIQTMRPMIAATTQSEDNSPVFNHHPRHGSVSNRPQDIEKALKLLDVNFPYDTPNNGRMINIKELIEKNRPSTRIASAEKRRLNFDNIFQISPQVHSRKNAVPSSANKVTVTPRKERQAIRVIEGDVTPVSDGRKAQRSQSQKCLDGYFTKIKTTVVQKKEFSIVRKDNGLARK